jgi:hypothetical protein
MDSCGSARVVQTSLMRAALYLPGYFFIAFATWFLAGVLPCSAQDAAWLRRPWKQDITIPAGWYQGPEGHGGEADIWTEDKFAIIWKEGSLVENAVFRQGTSARMEVKRCHFRKVYTGLSLWCRLDAADCLFENSTFGKINPWFDTKNSSTK